jgi:hypothetical protein
MPHQREAKAMPADLNSPIFQYGTKAPEWLKARIWPDGPFCPHWGEAADDTRMQRKARRAGGLSVQLLPRAIHGNDRDGRRARQNSAEQADTRNLRDIRGRTGMSARQLHRMLGISYKSTWFMAHRIREAMREGKLLGGLGRQNKVVEVDETYICGSESDKHKSKRRKDGARWPVGKVSVVVLVERDGSVRSIFPRRRKVCVRSSLLRSTARHTNDGRRCRVYSEITPQQADVKTA